MIPPMATKRSHDDDDLEPVTTDDVAPTTQPEMSEARQKFMAGEIGWHQLCAAENG